MLPLLLSEIQKLTGAQLIGNPSHKICEVQAIRDIKPGNDNSKYLTWVNDKNSGSVDPALQPGLLILSPNAYPYLQKAALNFLVTTEPRKTFFKILDHCFSNNSEVGASSSAFIHPSAKMGESCFIGHNVVIEADVQIGNFCRVLHNTVILHNTQIGNHVKIGCNCTIGNEGFGYEQNESEIYKQLPHAGNVIIEDYVDIHNNTCIDRAVIGSTIIGKDVKIDNLVHIAHGVRIGNNSLIIANSMIGGSTDIGENTWISPCVSINNALKIAPESMIGTGSVVLQDNLPFSWIYGNPARQYGWRCKCHKYTLSFTGGKTTCNCGKKYETDGKNVTLIEDKI